MNVSRDVILDLLPIYMAGEASAGTRSLVDAYLQQDPALAARVRAQASDLLAGMVPPAPVPELELRSLRRARALIGWQKWLFGLGIGFTALALSLRVSYENGRLTALHLMLQEQPLQFGYFAVMAALCWAGYYVIRRRLRRA